jgi:hypothetical protein
MTALHVFALNTDDPDLRHTNLTRALGEKPDLPPLAEWLGLESLTTREIELFPVKDLGDMSLSDYITAAFGPDPDIPAAVRQRLDALDGSVLLVPDSAFAIDPTPGAQATAIAVLPLARPDHRAALPRAEVAAVTTPAPPAPDPASPHFGKVVWLMMGAVAVALILWLIL